MALRNHPFARCWNPDSFHYPRIAGLLAGRHLVLDVGCGDGTLARYLATGRTPSPDGLGVREDGDGRGALRHEVIGIDIDKPVLPADSPGAHFVLADALQLPYPPAGFDAVVCADALQMVDGRAALAEMRRVVRPGGRIVVLGRARSTGRPGELLADARDAALAIRIRFSPVQRWQPDVLDADAELSWARYAALVGEVLPGARFERVRMRRWLAVWDAPAG